MSAISGIIGLNLKKLPYETILQFNNVMNVQKHRGPDGVGFCAFNFDGENVFVDNILKINSNYFACGIIGHNLLRVNKDRDVVQPYCNHKKSIGVAYDGQIVNTNDIKLHLLTKGYSFETGCDAEILLHAYIEFGVEEMAKMLNGVFTVTIFDLDKRVVHVFGDRYGAKPLYYTTSSNRFIFASELKGIIQLEDFERKLNLDACNARLIFARTGTRVLLDGVKLLAPCEIITITTEEIYSTTYFDWDSYKRDEGLFKSDDDAIHATEDVFKKVVSRQLENKRMGIQLSGGIDSTLTAFYAKQQSPDSFSEAVAIIDGTGDKGEEYYINYVANKLGLNLHKFEMTPSVFFDSYENMVWHNDAPVYRPYFSCFMQLGKLAKEYADVLFCGEGADELTGGYSRFAGGALVPFLSRLDVSNNAVKSYKDYAEYVVMAGETITDFTTLGYKNIEGLLEERKDIFRGFKGSDLTKHLKFEIRECLPEASLRQDKMTMASSIQNRAPFLDNELVDLLMTMDEEYLVRFVGKSPFSLNANPFNWMQGKWIFKEMVSKHFGRDFAYRKKMIMNLKERDMISSLSFLEYAHDVIFPKMKERGIFDAKMVQEKFDNSENISSKEFTSMWKALSTETWCQLFLDKKQNSNRQV